MPVNDQTDAWSKFQDERDKVADMISGSDRAVQRITPVAGWNGTDLQLAQDRAYFLPMVSRTQATFTGLVFIKDPTRTFPDGLEALTDDVTQTGQELDRFAEATFDDVMATGGVAVVVDREPIPTGLSVAEAEAQGYRPFMRRYDANNIIEARVEKVRGRPRLTRFRAREIEVRDKPTDEDPFATEDVELIRVFRLEDGVYTQQVYRQEVSDGEFVAQPPITPTLANQPIDEIPVWFSNGRDGEPRCAKPELADLADINIKHLNNSASMEWALSWLGCPLMFGAGFTVQGGIKIGSSEAVIVKDPNAKLEIVQADAGAVGALKQAMDDKRRDAAALGARMLSEESKQGIAEQTARIQRAGEASVVGSAAKSVSECLSHALRFMARWAGLPETVTVGGGGADGKPAATMQILYWLNTDLIPTKLDAQMLTALLDAWIRGAISKPELFQILQGDELIDPAKSFADHEEEIASEVPPQPTAAELAAALGQQAGQAAPGAVGAGAQPA